MMQALIQIDQLMSIFTMNPGTHHEPEVEFHFAIQTITATKGHGWVATKAIPQGTIIYQSTADICIRSSELNESTLQKQLRQLGASQQAAFHELISHGQYDSKLLDIFSCNAIFYELPHQSQTSESMAGIFLLFARLNHDCQANARWFFDEFDDDNNNNSEQHKLPLRLITIRDIQMDEEITVSYFDIANKRMSTRVRRYELFQRWGFHCSCAWCSVDTTMEKQMDDALEKFHTFMDECDDIILFQAARGTNNQRAWQRIYEYTNECLIMLAVLFDDDINLLWKCYKRRLPAVMKLDSLDLQEKQKCMDTFNHIYKVTRLDFDQEFVATFHALDILKVFKYQQQFMRKYANILHTNRLQKYLQILFDNNTQTDAPSGDDDDDDEDSAGKLFSSDSDDDVLAQ